MARVDNARSTSLGIYVRCDVAKLPFDPKLMKIIKPAKSSLPK